MKNEPISIHQATTSRRRVLQALGLAAGAGALGAVPASRSFAQRDAATLRNIVVIFLDDVGIGDIGCYGSSLIRTAAIDSLAERGARWTNMYSSAPSCTPSRAALLTGCYPPRVNLPRVLFPQDANGLAAHETTLAEYLKEAGYATGIFGKWHLGARPEHHPSRHGFDRFFGLLYSNDMTPLQLYDGDAVVEDPVDQATLTRRYTEHAIEFIRNAGDRPFFAYIAHTMAHIPLFVEDEFAGTSRAGLYGDVIESLDHYIGMLLDELDRLGKTDDTIVMFTSDNGPWFEGGTVGLRGRKGNVEDGGLRMPFIASWPGAIEPGTTITEPAALVDVLPTLAALSGVELDAERPIDGRDFSAHLAGEPARQRDPIHCYADGSTTLAAVRHGRWKLHIQGRWRLYDMDRDPEESYDLASRHPDLVAWMGQQAAAYDAALKADHAQRY